MSNTYFQFKQFKVAQENTAMKVSTDACIQGAWTPVSGRVQYVLDIGAGTGLLTLMLAQRNQHILVDAIEIDEDAAAQAADNIAQSPFANNATVHCADIRNWQPHHRYQLIICNPPFFTNSLLGNKDKRNLARHNNTFTHIDMAIAIARLLDDTGMASVLLPASEQTQWETTLQSKGLFVNQRLFVQPYAHSAANRVVSICSKSKEVIADESVIIYRQPNQYTESFVELMQAYYLHL
jgi:tRNA1Val (adenine37-N6)-methyltransferase